MNDAAERNYASYGNLGLAFLSFASGCTDVLTFLKLGNVFTSAMTGNAALLAIEIGRGNLYGALRALAALFSFALGVALAARMDAAWRTTADEWRRFSLLLLLELVFLTASAGLWSVSPDPIQGAALYGVILLSALSMGIQAVAAGTIRSGINTIVFTSVLVRIVMFVTGALSQQSRGSGEFSKIGPHLGTFASYVFGALLAAIAVWHFFRAVVWAPIAAVIIALALSEVGSAFAGQVRRRH